MGMPQTWKELNQKFGEKAVGQAIADSIARQKALCEKRNKNHSSKQVCSFDHKEQ